ncbi:hypothetical protein AVEN_99493-1 [Araneus ventricosus]|uniref:Uncharacterized protein n=1 Tax=Araneus ventricosus TaxID=182803 RepID=A0A4Y2TBT3_ARAVE|nr:hypothetical protein AVEN_99493-1 [Araneus ventricosus]
MERRAPNECEKILESATLSVKSEMMYLDEAYFSNFERLSSLTTPGTLFFSPAPTKDGKLSHELPADAAAPDQMPSKTPDESTRPM